MPESVREAASRIAHEVVIEVQALVRLQKCADEMLATTNTLLQTYKDNKKIYLTFDRTCRSKYFFNANKKHKIISIVSTVNAIKPLLKDVRKPAENIIDQAGKLRQQIELVLQHYVLKVTEANKFISTNFRFPLDEQVSQFESELIPVKNALSSSSFQHNKTLAKLIRDFKSLHAKTEEVIALIDTNKDAYQPLIADVEKREKYELLYNSLVEHINKKTAAYKKVAAKRVFGRMSEQRKESLDRLDTLQFDLNVNFPDHPVLAVGQLLALIQADADNAELDHRKGGFLRFFTHRLSHSTLAREYRAILNRPEVKAAVAECTTLACLELPDKFKTHALI